MPGSLLGNHVRRVEDPALLVGAAQFVDDLPLAGGLHLAFVRSPVAHADVTAVDTGEAAGQLGVVAVYAAGDLDLPLLRPMMATDDTCARPPLATGRVRFVGDVVAAVVAESRGAAVDAAERVVVDYHARPAAVDPEAALAPDAPVQFDGLGTNLFGGFRQGSADEALGGAEVVVRGRFENQRIAVLPMEGNAIAVVPGDDGNGHDLTVFVATQMPHGWHQAAVALFGLEPERLRVVAPHVGGAFGAKIGVTAEHAVAVAAARRLGRPVKWVESRSENLVAMPHGRGQVQYIELGLRRDGTITGLRARIVGDGGAYAGFGGLLPQFTTHMMAQGPYRIPKLCYEVATAHTNTTPMGAFRGAGRPEAAAFLERILDMAADELGLDPVDLRLRNFLPPDAFPHTTLTGVTYDVGDYALSLAEAQRVAGYDDLLADQAARRARGDRIQLGIGIAAYVEVTAGGAGSEYGSVEVHADGKVTVAAGTSAHGQGHATSFSMLVAERLGVPLSDITFVQSDTAVVPRGGGTGGSRSLQIGGSAVQGAADEILERGRALAADLLEAAPGDIVVVGPETGPDGDSAEAAGAASPAGLAVAGVPSRVVTWAQLAEAAADRGGPLQAGLNFTQAGATFPFGAHIAVVEVDLDTGTVRLLRHVAVDDCGRVLNPLIVEGQQHGGLAQGAAQALFEQFVYDEDGNPLTATLADYAMPSAAELPSFEASVTETPTPLNPLGAKGIGESGTVGATPAVQNAVVDALSYLGIRHLDMPLTPERVWRAVTAAEAGSPPDPWRDPPAVFETLPERGAVPETGGQVEV